MPITVLIKAARPADADAIGDLYVAARAAAMPFLREVHGPDEMRGWIKRVLLPRETSWVAWCENEICGFMTLDRGDIDQLHLRPDRRREGIGRILIDYAKALSPDHLELVCFQENHPARAFYEAQGFVPVAFGDGTMNEEGAPDVFYEWRPAALR